MYRVVRRRLAGVSHVFSPVPAVETASNVLDEGAAAGQILLDIPANRRPTAVPAQSDLLAAGVLRAAERLGLRVPEDVSVTGFDGADLPWLAPAALTTVEQGSDEKGRIAARAVLELLAGRTPVDVTLPVQVRPGTTTGPARSSQTRGIRPT
jgi:DNA-binding LacI/PurR family transcriptional regulator